MPLPNLSFAVCWVMWGQPVISLKSKQFRLERSFCRLIPFLAFPARLDFCQCFVFPYGDLPMERGRESRGYPHTIPASWVDILLPCMPLHTRQMSRTGNSQDVTAFHPISQAFWEWPEQSMLAGQATGHWLRWSLASIHIQLVSLLLLEFR